MDIMKNKVLATLSKTIKTDVLSLFINHKFVQTSGRKAADYSVFEYLYTQIGSHNRAYQLSPSKPAFLRLDFSIIHELVKNHIQINRLSVLGQLPDRSSNLIS